MKAIVPVKKSSKRVPNKNFRPFYQNKSLFDLKLEALLKVSSPTDIYVSSESPDVEEEARRYGVNFLLRDPVLALNETPIGDVIQSVVSQVPGEDDVMWVQVTEPFFDKFQECLDTWEKVKADYDSLVVVKPIRNYFLDEKGHPLNFGFGPWHLYSQLLPKWYMLPFSMHILPRSTVRRCGYYVGAKPYFYEHDSITFDIDSVQDFEQAAAVYKVVKEAL